MKLKESLYSRNDHQSWLPLKLSHRILIFILMLVRLGIPSMSAVLCDPNVSFLPFPDYDVTVLRLTSTSVHIKWTNPYMIQRTFPDYYCVVYNSDSVIVLPPKSNRTFQYEITRLTPDIFYNIIVKPCVNNECSFARSLIRRVHT